MRAAARCAPHAGLATGCSPPTAGMLPGLLAGHYTTDEVHIDLATPVHLGRGEVRLRRDDGARSGTARDLVRTAIPMRRSEAISGDRPSGRTALRRPPIGYDRLSLDTGSTPDLSVPGAARARHAGQAGVRSFMHALANRSASRSMRGVDRRCRGERADGGLLRTGRRESARGSPSASSVRRGRLRADHGDCGTRWPDGPCGLPLGAARPSAAERGVPNASARRAALAAARSARHRRA